MFRLNRLTDYGVVVLSQISLESGALCSAQHIARHTGATLPTVAKVLNILSASISWTPTAARPAATP